MMVVGSCGGLAQRLFQVGRRLRSQAQQVADRVDEVGAVHGVEVEIAHAAVDQVEHLLGGDRGGDQLAGGDVVFQTLEAVGEPLRHRRADALSKQSSLLEVLHRHDPRHDRDRDSAGAHAIEIAEVEIVLEKYWVMARLAPASTLAASMSMSASTVGLSGCRSG